MGHLVQRNIRRCRDPVRRSVPAHDRDVAVGVGMGAGAVGDAETGAPVMRGGRGWLAIALAALVVIGAEAATRLGPATPAAATAGAAPSTTWLCPHGGGPGWTATIEIANPTAAT